MESVKFHLLLVIVLIANTILLSHPVLSSGDEEDNLIQGINSYRQSLQLSPLSKNEQAHCLADKLSDQLDDQPCSTSTVYAKAIPASSGQPFTDYQNLLSKCNIDVNHTTDGIILPVCVPKLVPTLVLTNYTHTPYARYLNDSRFTGIGADSEDDWMVVVMSTSTPQGSLASAAVGLVSEISLGFYLMVLLLSGGLVLISYPST